MKNDSRQIYEDFFDNNIRVNHILPLIGSVHTDSLSDELEELFEDPADEVIEIFKKHLGVTLTDNDFSKGIEHVADKVMRACSLGFLVQYDIPVPGKMHGTRENESGFSSFGFGHCQQRWMYLETLTINSYALILAHAEKALNELKDKQWKKQEAEASK